MVRTSVLERHLCCPLFLGGVLAQANRVYALRVGILFLFNGNVYRGFKYAMIG